MDSFQAVSYVRLLGSAMVAKLAPKYLVPGPASSATLTSGTTGDKGYPGLAANSAYCVAREGLARALAIELAPVRVNCVSPWSGGDAEFGCGASGAEGVCGGEAGEGDFGGSNGHT